MVAGVDVDRLAVHTAGGEGAVLRQYTTARLLLGQAALNEGDATSAYDHFRQAMDTPESLGEAYHPLQAKADVNYWLGRCLADLGRKQDAQERFRQSAYESGDFTEMAVTEYSPLTYYRGLALRELGREDEADQPAKKGKARNAKYCREQADQDRTGDTHAHARGELPKPEIKIHCDWSRLWCVGRCRCPRSNAGSGIWHFLRYRAGNKSSMPDPSGDNANF